MFVCLYLCMFVSFLWTNLGTYFSATWHDSIKHGLLFGGRVVALVAKTKFSMNSYGEVVKAKVGLADLLVQTQDWAFSPFLFIPSFFSPPFLLPPPPSFFFSFFLSSSLFSTFLSLFFLPPFVLPSFLLFSLTSSSPFFFLFIHLFFLPISPPFFHAPLFLSSPFYSLFFFSSFLFLFLPSPPPPPPPPRPLFLPKFFWPYENV